MPKSGKQATVATLAQATVTVLGVALGTLVLCGLLFAVDTQSDLTLLVAVPLGVAAISAMIARHGFVSVLIAAAGGVPLILKPFFWPILSDLDDQPMNLTSETHLYYLLPGVALLALAGILVAVVAKNRERRVGSRLFALSSAAMVGIIGVVLALGFVKSTSKSEGEILTLGGWFAGHGNVVSGITGTLFSEDGLMLEPSAVDAVAFSDDGKTIVSKARGDIIVWQLDGTVKSRRRRAALVRLAGASHYISKPEYGKVLTLWSTEGHTKQKQIDMEKMVRRDLGHYSYVKLRAVGLRDDGHVMALLDISGGALLYDITTEKLLLRFAADVYQIAFSHSGRTTAIGHHEQTRIIDVTTGKTLKTLAIGFGLVRDMVFSPNGEYLAMATPKEVQLFDVAERTVTRRLKLQARPGMKRLCFSPDGKVLAASFKARSREPVIQLYEVQSGRPLKQFKGHRCEVTALAFSPGGRILASGSSDQTVKLWRVPQR